MIICLHMISFPYECRRVCIVLSFCLFYIVLNHFTVIKLIKNFNHGFKSVQKSEQGRANQRVDCYQFMIRQRHKYEIN